MHTPERQYVPQQGQLIKLATWEAYTTRKLSPWVYLRVTQVFSDGKGLYAHHAPSPMDPTKDETNASYLISLAEVQAPLGWEPRYTIYCKPEETDKVLSWFARGIVVRVSHDMGGPMGSVFQPADNATQPHWQYPEVTDSILPADCPKLFRVVSVVKEEVNPYSNPSHPNLRAMGRSARAKAIKAMRADGWSVEYLPYGGGYWERVKETVVHNWGVL